MICKRSYKYLLGDDETEQSDRVFADYCQDYDDGFYYRDPMMIEVIRIFKGLRLFFQIGGLSQAQAEVVHQQSCIGNAERVTLNGSF